MAKKFALIGVGGYIAPRHLRAVKDTGNELVAALDKNDSVGILDSYTTQARFFTEFERFDRHLEKLRRKPGQGVDYVTICSPNYLHDAHVRFALRIDADAINTILQLRLHPAIVALKERIDQAPAGTVHDIDLTYITTRGYWYLASWKGDMEKSGGIATNIGVHFFDMLAWIFGPVRQNVVHLHEATKAAGYLELERGRVRWFLSLDRDDLPKPPEAGRPATYRAISVDGEEVEFSAGFTDLHTESYRRILAGDGFGCDAVLPSIEIVSAIRNAAPVGKTGEYHPMLSRVM